MFWENIQNILIFSIISQHWHGTGYCKPSPWKKRTYVSYIIYIVAAVDWVAQEARAPAAMILMKICVNILAFQFASEGLILPVSDLQLGIYSRLFYIYSH